MELFMTCGTVILLVTFIEPVQTIKCYNCNSDTEPACASSNKDILKPFEMDCDRINGLGYPDSTRCVVSVTDVRIIRTCYHPLPNVLDNECKKVPNICTCSSNFCNSYARPLIGNTVTSFPNTGPGQGAGRMVRFWSLSIAPILMRLRA